MLLNGCLWKFVCESVWDNIIRMKAYHIIYTGIVFEMWFDNKMHSNKYMGNFLIKCTSLNLPVTATNFKHKVNVTQF